MAASALPRHRGTWSTIFVILFFALGVCTVVFGIFNLATSVLLGLSTIALGIGLIIPGVWWLRWYQKPRMLRGLIPLSLFFLIPGAISTGITSSNEVNTPELEVVPSTTTSSTSSTVRTPSPVPTSASEVPHTTIEMTPSSSEPPPVIESSAPAVVPPVITPPPNTPPTPAADPSTPLPTTNPSPMPTGNIEPEIPTTDPDMPPEGPTTEIPVEDTPVPTPVSEPANPWQYLTNRFLP